MTVVHGGSWPHFTRVHVDLRPIKGSFRWRLAWSVTDVCESTQHESRELSEPGVDGNHSSSNCSCEEFRRTPGLSRQRGCVQGSQGHPSTSVQLCLRPSSFAVPTDTTTGEPFSFFLPKSSSTRSSLLSACRLIFTKQNVVVITRDCRVH